VANELIECLDSTPFENRHVQQLIAAWRGFAGKGVPFRATAVNDDTLYAVDVKNAGSGGKHIRVTHSSGSPTIFQATDSGVLVSPNGVLAAANYFIYPGMVLYWNGTSGSIPTGWNICDGTNGTPDLRDKFVVGAGTTYALAATGGATTHTHSHSHTSAAHTHTIAHTHTYDIDHNHASVSSDAPSSAGEVASGTGSDRATALHTHEVDLPNYTASKTSDAASVADSGSTAPGVTGTDATAGSSLPPYYALYLMQRIT